MSQSDLNNCAYYKKLAEYRDNLATKMYLFEITKECGYSAFVYVYKNQTLGDLYKSVQSHFECEQIVSLYIRDYLSGEKIEITQGDQTPLSQFIYNQTMHVNLADYINLSPIYPLPLPVVYRIYLDDGHEHK